MTDAPRWNGSAKLAAGDKMAEFVFRAIGAGRADRSHRKTRAIPLDLRSNLFVEVLVGLVVWAIIANKLTVFINAVFAKPEAASDAVDGSSTGM
jgi:hypothetical protein